MADPALPAKPVPSLITGDKMKRGMPWFRMYSEFAFDPKIQTMSEEMQRRFVMLLCFKCAGFIPTSDQHMRNLLKCYANVVKKTKETFVNLGLISDDWDILKWSERQFQSDVSTGRVQKYREKEKRFGNVSETAKNRTETEQNRILPPLSSPSPKPDKEKSQKELIEKMIAAFKKSWYENIQFYMTKYPGIDYNLHQLSMEEWIEANPTKAKKRKDWNLFAQRWLSKEKPMRAFNKPVDKFRTHTDAKALENEYRRSEDDARKTEIAKILGWDK